MSEYREQYQRFYNVLRAKETYSVNCDECPIKKECFEYTDKLSIVEAENAPCCEELLFNYILFNKTP